MIERKKMSKKAQKELNKRDRVWFDMNLGTRTMKSKKDYNRAENKRIKEDD